MVCDFFSLNFKENTEEKLQITLFLKNWGVKCFPHTNTFFYMLRIVTNYHQMLLKLSVEITEEQSSGNFPDLNV